MFCCCFFRFNLFDLEKVVDENIVFIDCHIKGTDLLCSVNAPNS